MYFIIRGWEDKVKKLTVVLILMFLPVLVLGQDADELEHKFQLLMDDLKEQQRIMEEEIQYQKNNIEMELQMMIRSIDIKLLTESIVRENWDPTYRMIMWEPVESPYLYLPSSASNFPTLDMAAPNTIVFPKSISTSPLKPVTHPIATPPVTTIPVVALPAGTLFDVYTCPHCLIGEKKIVIGSNGLRGTYIWNGKRWVLFWER
jgi:hypothetical protein